jgi:hypothetical protein
MVELDNVMLWSGQQGRLISLFFCCYSKSQVYVVNIKKPDHNIKCSIKVLFHNHVVMLSYIHSNFRLYTDKMFCTLGTTN